MSSMSTSKRISAVVDNNILMDLWELDRLDLLFNTFENIVIPEIIYTYELLDEIKTEIIKFDHFLVSIDSVTGYEMYMKLTENKKYKNLSKSDKIAVSCAKQEAVFCTSNDALVRKACDEYEIECLGILGVLKRAYEIQIINNSELKSLCGNLLDTSCFITKKVIESFLSDV